jgi:hypothetical protein
MGEIGLKKELLKYRAKLCNRHSGFASGGVCLVLKIVYSMND